MSPVLAWAWALSRAAQRFDAPGYPLLSRMLDSASGWLFRLWLWALS